MQLGNRKIRAAWKDAELRIIQKYCKTHNADDILTMINEISKVTRSRNSVITKAGTIGYHIADQSKQPQ